MNESNTRKADRAGGNGEAITEIALAERISQGGRKFGILAGDWVVPPERAGMRRMLTVEREGKRQVIGEMKDGLGTEPWAVFVRGEPWALELTLAGAKADGQGHGWDAGICGRWAVGDIERFSQAFALQRVSPELPIGAAEMLAWVMGRVSHHIRDALAGYSIEELRDGQALPPTWWEQQLCEWLEAAGLRAKVDHVRWSSASAEAVEIERRQREQDQRVQAERQRQREQAIAQCRQEAQYEQKLKEIEADQLLSQKQRQAAADAVEHERERRRADFQRQMRELAIDLERINSQFELEMTEARQRLAARTQFVGISTEKARQDLVQSAAEFETRQKTAALKFEYLKSLWEQKVSQAAIDAADRRALLQKEAQEQAAERQRRSELEKLEHEERMRHIRVNGALSEKQKTIQIEQEQVTLEKIRLEIDQARQAGQRAQEKHELEMNFKRAELERLQSSQNHEQDVAAKLHTAGKWVPALDAQLVAMIQALDSADPRLAHQAREFLTRIFGVSPQTFESAGYDVSTQRVLQRFLAQQECDRNPVSLEKPEIRSRDIGLQSVNVLSIGSPLNFTLHSNRPGYLTLINLGTSGLFWLMCPGSLCAPERSRIAAGQAYPIPGSVLFPYKHGLIDNGPNGWEHLVAIVSDRPLLGPGRLVSMSLSKELNIISRGAMGQLMGELEAAPGAWTAGVLSFEVE